VLSRWMLVLLILAATRSGLGYFFAAVAAVFFGRRISATLEAVETGPREVAAVAAGGLWGAALQVASAICRHYWPVAVLAAVLFRRCRHVVLAAAVVDGLADWANRRNSVAEDNHRVGLLSYLLLKRLDDIAYGLGLWTGVVRERHVGALKPQIRS